MREREERTEDFQLSEQYQTLKVRMHVRMIRVLEEEKIPLSEWSLDLIRSFVEKKLHEHVAQERLAVNRRELEALRDDMLNELIGYGPLQALIDDGDVSDILINGHRNVFTQRAGKLGREKIRFVDDRHVLRIIQKIIAPLGRRIDETSPMVDARLPDGSHVHVIIPPVSLEGPCISIRKFRRDPLSVGDLLASDAMSEELLQLLMQSVRGRCNIVVSGGTGAGKTTLLNVLAQSIPHEERLVTIEDTAELRLSRPHVVRLETRPANLDGFGDIDARTLLRNALRMRPDRVLIGEIRGSEVIDLLQAMNTGHHGSMSTIHANSPRDCLSRLELLVGLAGYQGTERTLRHSVLSAIDLVVQVESTSDGERKVVAVSEVTGIADGLFQMHDLFFYDAERRCFQRGAALPTRPRLRAAIRAPGQSSSVFRGFTYA